jgi:hypothetical protein
VSAVKRTAAEVLATCGGARISRKCRATGTVVTLYDGRESGDDIDGGRWQTVCEDHGTIICHETKRFAELALSHPDDWCDVCMGNEPDPNAEPKETL